MLFTGSGPQPLPAELVASDINDQRVLVSGNRLHDLDTGVTTTIPLPPGNWQGFVSAALNDNADFCGSIRGWSGCSTFPIRYRQGVGWEFLGGCATTTSATAINDHGDTLLYYYMTTSGVSLVPEGYFGLDSLIDPGEGAWFVQYSGANAINNARQVVATARQGLSGPIVAVRLTPIAPALDADTNCDGVVNFDDIDPFVVALAGQGAYEAAYPGCAWLNADASGDGTVIFDDIDAFVALLSS